MTLLLAPSSKHTLPLLASFSFLLGDAFRRADGVGMPMALATSSGLGRILGRARLGAVAGGQRRGLHPVAARLGRPGSYSRTDGEVEIEYPAEQHLPPSRPVGGLRGQYLKPTLASFSLDRSVGLVTGGARGLGLVIGQGMVHSGADLALVDMNSWSLPAPPWQLC